MFKFLENLLTKKRTEIPLLFINFDYWKYKECGKIGSCTVKLHPILKDDEQLNEMLKIVVDYVRRNYDMEEM
jgi:hypothetical protein